MATRDRIAAETVLVPAHFDAEVLSAVLRLIRHEELTSERGQLALLGAARLPAERVALRTLLPGAFALRDRCSAYDAFYVALARRSSAVLLTSDAPLARAAQGYAEVELVKTGR